MMKKYLFLLYLCVATVCNAQEKAASAPADFQFLKKLIDEKDFFSARDVLAYSKKQISPFHLLIVEAYLDNAFNRPAASNQKINVLLAEYKVKLEDTLQLDLLRLKQENYGRLYEYTEALAVMNEITSKYAAQLNQEELDDYRNTGMIWQTLSGQPKQDVIINGDTYLKMTRDKAGLANLEVSAGKKKTGFIFDTGANFSTVTRSTAKKMKMKMLGGSIEVGAITGAKVNAALALCPELRIGDIIVKNAVFLVFPDEALAFPQIEYQINGILGFPVIEAMKEIQITKKDEFIVPKKRSEHAEQNMALDFLTPVINIKDEYYTFDTGATVTSLYQKYLYKYHYLIAEGPHIETELTFGGAGGMKTVKGFLIPFSPYINGNRVEVENVQLYLEPVDDDKEQYYGNIGQDLIKKFAKMTINFESMFIKFD